MELKFNLPRGEMVAVSRDGEGLMLREFPRRKKRKATVGFYACYRGPGDSIWGQVTLAPISEKAHSATLHRLG